MCVSGMQAVVVGRFCLLEGSVSTFQPLLTHSLRVVGRVFALLFVSVPSGVQGSGVTESRSMLGYVFWQ